MALAIATLSTVSEVLHIFQMHQMPIIKDHKLTQITLSTSHHSVIGIKQIQEKDIKRTVICIINIHIRHFFVNSFARYNSQQNFTSSMIMT